MEINISNEQYARLVKLLYLGDWMVNSFRFERVEDFDEISQYIFSLAEKFGLASYFEKDENQLYFPTGEFDEEMSHFIYDYNDFNLFNDLMHALAHRDVIAEHGEKKTEAMSHHEFQEKEAPYLEKYAEEFEKNGIDNLYIK